MLSHLLKLNWNKKKQNFLLITEIFLCFIVLFAVFTTVFHYRRNYDRPAGFDYKNKLTVSFMNPWAAIRTDSSRLYFENLATQIRQIPEIETVSLFAGNYPCSPASHKQLVHTAADQAYAVPYIVDSGFLKVFDLTLIAGRWFNSSDPASAVRPALITESLRDILFPDGNALNRIFTEENKEMKVVGILRDFKTEGDYQNPEPVFFLLADSSAMKESVCTLVAGYASLEEGKAEAAIFKAVQDITDSRDVKVDEINALRKKKNNITLVPVLILVIVSAFLVFNVSLGLWGVLWLTINKRKPEIALRVAVGADKKHILQQIMGEVLVLTSFALAAGSFFALQFLFLNVFNLSRETYLSAYLCALAGIYLITGICALYPAYQATRIYPAVTLHNE